MEGSPSTWTSIRGLSIVSLHPVLSLFLSLFSFYSLLDGHSPSFQLALSYIHVFHNTSHTDLIQFILSTERKINTTNRTISLVPFVRNEFGIKCGHCKLLNKMTYMQTGQTELN